MINAADPIAIIRSNVARLRKLDSCAVSDALDRLQLTGQVTHLRRHSGSGRIAGRVVTMKLGTGDPPPGPIRHLGTHAVEGAGPDNVIVIEQAAHPDAACWGGLLTLGAKLRGISGVIADGPVRDVDEARDLNFPIFAAKATCRTARGRVVEKATNVPVRVGEIDVTPGDYVIADESGVVFITPPQIIEVLTLAEEIAGRESAMADAIRKGTPISQVMGGSYETMLKPTST